LSALTEILFFLFVVMYSSLANTMLSALGSAKEHPAAFAAAGAASVTSLGLVASKLLGPRDKSFVPDLGHQIPEEFFHHASIAKKSHENAVEQQQGTFQILFQF
jgi:hypothetical protein